MDRIRNYVTYSVMLYLERAHHDIVVDECPSHVKADRLGEILDEIYFNRDEMSGTSVSARNTKMYERLSKAVEMSYSYFRMDAGQDWSSKRSVANKAVPISWTEMFGNDHSDEVIRRRLKSLLRHVERISPLVEVVSRTPVECGICLEEQFRLMKTRCQHLMCEQCFDQLGSDICPYCRARLSINVGTD